MDHLFPYPKMGYSFTELLEDPLTRKLLGHDAVHAEKTPFIKGVASRLAFLLNDPIKHLSFLKIGYSALEAFLQANATGPPLDFDSVPVIIPEIYRDEYHTSLKQEIFDSLTVEGDAAYVLTPRIELFWLGKMIMSNETIAEAGFNGRRARFRVNFWHQKLLQEKSDTLREQLYTDADILEQQLGARFQNRSAASEEHFIEFLIERAVIRTFYGDDSKAREDLTRAAKIRSFRFALTGALGKRTKFQEHDLSQLVVLAKSRDHEPETYSSRKSSRAEGASSRKSSHVEPSMLSSLMGSKTPGAFFNIPNSPTSAISVSSEQDRPVSPMTGKMNTISPNLPATKPETLQLNDDTLLEGIAFRRPSEHEPKLAEMTDESSLPPELVELSPSDQPLLFPMDSIILLSTASSITNTSPADGLTREETLPYATRVLEGGSSNWQVYTQALLVRSRIEGYKSRTMERGLLQLQALVDQVIAETTEASITPNKTDEADAESSAPTTFLPKAKLSESASVAERLKYIHQLSPPLRWELEAELAQRWTQMGGLRTALEIYERLQMKAEVALCLAATDREAEAVKLLKSLVFENSETEIVSSTPIKMISPIPSDAPRLLSILGDILVEPKYYMLAWSVSDQRYARAQRSLGRYYIQRRNYQAAADAYTLALSITRLDGPAWFSLGCAQLELEDWPGAIDSFTRVVQLDDNDAEAWSNLAAALLKLPTPADPPDSDAAAQPPLDDQDEDQIDDQEDEDAIDDSSDDDYVLDNQDEDEINDDEEEFVEEELLISSVDIRYKHKHEALRALRRAAHLKREDARIWDNYLTVAASIPPSQNTPWNEIIQAIGHIIDLRSKKEGERSVDLNILEVLMTYVMRTCTYPDNNDDDETEANLAQTQSQSQSQSQEPEPEQDRPKLPFTARSLLHLIDTKITPLASSPTLFTLLSRLSIWRHRPSESLSFTEKAWRTTTSRPAIYDSEPGWNEVVTATVALADAYRDLGELERERTGGLVEKGWKFKSRSAVRGVMGRGKELWEGGKGWEKLEACMEGLK